MHLIDGVEVLQVQMSLHAVHGDMYSDSNEVTSVTVVEGLVVHMALQKPRCIVGKLREGVVTILGGLAVYIDE